MKLTIMRRREIIQTLIGLEPTDPEYLKTQILDALIKKVPLVIDSKTSGMIIFPYDVIADFTFVIKEEMVYEEKQTPTELPTTNEC